MPFPKFADPMTTTSGKRTRNLGTAAITQQRGSAGFSVYLKCDINGEDRADELVKKVLAPVYDRHVGEGQLTSWNWLKHNVGGEYRRLLIMSAADHKTLMKTTRSDSRRF